MHDLQIPQGYEAIVAALMLIEGPPHVVLEAIEATARLDAL